MITAFVMFCGGQPGTRMRAGMAPEPMGVFHGLLLLNGHCRTSRSKAVANNAAPLESSERALTIWPAATLIGGDVARETNAVPAVTCSHVASVLPSMSTLAFVAVIIR